MIGRVDLFGRIVEHEYGYRAEAAVVRALALVHEETGAAGWACLRFEGYVEPCERLVESLEQRYQCDVRLVRGFGDLYRVLAS